MLLLLLLELVDRGILVRFETTANEVGLRESGCLFLWRGEKNGRRRRGIVGRQGAVLVVEEEKRLMWQQGRRRSADVRTRVEGG